MALYNPGLALTGGTLTGPVTMGAGANIPQIVSASGQKASLTGTLTSTNLATATIPAGLLGTKGQIIARAQWSWTNSANNKSMRILFGGNTLVSIDTTTTTNGWNEAWVANDNATNAQYYTGTFAFTSAVGVNAGGTLAVDTTASVAVAFQGQLANTGDTIILRSYQVLFLPTV